MATAGGSTQPQQVSQAFILLGEAADGHEARLVPGEDRIPVVTQAPNSSIPPKSPSIHSTLAYPPIHSEIPFRPSHLQPSLSNTADQHPSMEIPLASSQTHSMLPGDQSMLDLSLTSSHIHSMLGNPGDPYMYSSPIAGWSADLLDTTNPDDFATNMVEHGAETNNSFSLWGLDIVQSDVEVSSNRLYLSDPPPEGMGIPAANAAAVGEIGRVVSGSGGGDLHVDVVGDVFPPEHGPHVQMEGDQSLDHVRVCTDISTVTNGAVLEDGSVEDDSVGQPRRRRRRRLLPVVVGHGASSFAAEPGCVGPESLGPTKIVYRSSSGFPDDGVQRKLYEWRKQVALFMEKKFDEEATIIRDLRRLSEFRENLVKRGITDDCLDGFVNPREAPSRQGRCITRFDPRLEGDKPKEEKKQGDEKRKRPHRTHSHWNETDAKLIRDPSAPGNIIVGLRRTLEYMNGSEKTHWRANEYVALQALGGDDGLQIQGEIAVRTVYKEEDSETAPPSKCPKSCPHCHSSEGSYIWKHMTKVFAKVEAKSGTALSLVYAICHKCDDKVQRCPPNFGTKNLNTHLGNVHGIRPPCKSQQVMMANKGKGKAIVLRG